MLKSLRSSITFPLCHIFKFSIEEGVFPELMKWAEVILLCKGKDMDIMVNYRLISLLLTMSKLLRKMKLYMQVSMISTKKRSCEHAIMELVGHILQARNSENHSASVYLDLSKAFDMLDHKLLLQKLDCYGVHGITNTWFKNYLKGCSLVAKVTTGPGEITYLNSYDITYGTAQVSCLGPLLFIIFCNDLHCYPSTEKLSYLLMIQRSLIAIDQLIS